MSYADDYPEHSRTSCSDDDPCNSDADGSGCARCNALRFDALTVAMERAEKWKNIAINLHSHPKFIRALTREELEDVLPSTQKFDPNLAALYAAMLQEKA